MSTDTRLRALAEWIWYSGSAGASGARTMLAPAAWLFGRVVNARNTSFDVASRTGQAPVPALPVLSVGNLTVGGTGKTPVSSWFAARLRARGAHPALVLRGYGDDEWRVHQLLVPGLPVLANRHRLHALSDARRDGADCAVLDDAFQHRQVTRVADVVLVSADRFSPDVHLLPAGPYREGLSALRRATAVVITVKAASETQLERTEAAVRGAAPDVPCAVVRLVPDRIVRAPQPTTHPHVSENEGDGHPLAWLGHQRVLLPLPMPRHLNGRWLAQVFPWCVIGGSPIIMAFRQLMWRSWPRRRRVPTACSAH
jgi:tetraacyldisaccharide 4'-kinase